MSPSDTAPNGTPVNDLMVRAENTAVYDFYKAAGYFEQPRAVFAKWLDGREPTP